MARFLPVDSVAGQNLSDAEEQERNERLNGRLHLLRSNFVAVHISGGIEERVCKTVAENTNERASVIELSEEQITNAPRAKTKGQRPLQTNLRNGKRKSGHKDDFGVLVVYALVGIEKFAKQREIEVRSKNTDKRRTGDEDRKVGTFEQRERLEPQRVASFGARRRSVRQRKSIESKHNRDNPVDNVEIFDSSVAQPTNEQVNSNPTERSEDKNKRRFFVVRNVLENNCVQQWNRRHEHQTGDEHQRPPEHTRFGRALSSDFMSNLIARKEGKAANELHKSKNLLSGKFLVSNGADNRGKQSAKRKRCVKRTLSNALVAAVSAESVRPASPNCEFKSVGNLQTNIHCNAAFSFSHGKTPIKKIFAKIICTKPSR